MREVELVEYKVTDSVSWRLLALGLGAAILRIWDLVRLGFNPVIAWATTGVFIISLLFSKGLGRKSTIVLEKKSLRVTTSLFGKKIKQSEKDISNAAWVRARIVGTHHTQIAIEVGTIGYTTTELVLVAYRNGKGVLEAEVLCDRVAEELKILNKGFKGLA